MSLSAGIGLRKLRTIGTLSVVILAVEAAILAMAIGGERAARRAEEAQTAKWDSQILRLENPAKPIDQPPVVKAAKAEMPPETLIIGVKIGDKARAYRLKALDDPDSHLVNDKIVDVPVTVAYCNLSQTARIYTNPRGSAALNVEVVGRLHHQMVIRVAGNLYFHPSGLPVEPDRNPPPLPCGVLTPAVMSWKAWTNLHPDTDVYVGDR